MDNDKQYDNIKYMILAVSFFIITLNTLIIYNIKFHPVADEIMSRLAANSVFSNVLVAKIASTFFLALFALGTKGKKSDKITIAQPIMFTALGLIIFFSSNIIATKLKLDIAFYATISVIGYILILQGFTYFKRLMSVNLIKDQFNKENKKFKQTKEKIENDYSVNIKTEDGWINIINPFRATTVLGTPGSGKSYVFVEEFIKQHIQKGFSMLIYDFKYPELSTVAWNYLKKYNKGYKVRPQFKRFDLSDPINSVRINPIQPDTIIRSSLDAQESAETLMINLDKNILKKKDYFSSSAIVYISSIIWYLYLIENKLIRSNINLPHRDTPIKKGSLCTIPHLIELSSRKDADVFKLLLQFKELNHSLAPFKDALDKEAFEQLAGQTSSARIPLSKLANKELFYLLSDNQIDLRINNPEAPVILCIGNDIERQKTYSPPLGLLISNIVKIINKPHRNPSSLIIDELPTIFINGIDNLIATARSNKVSTLLSFQDLSQMIRDYGREVADAIFNTIGNVISGSVQANTAKRISESIGKVVQKFQSINVSEKSTSINTSTSLQSLIPPETITQLSQGTFVGLLADTYDTPLETKIFHSKAIVDKSDKTKNPIPTRSIDPDQLEILLENNFQNISFDIDFLIDRFVNNQNSTSDE